MLKVYYICICFDLLDVTLDINKDIVNLIELHYPDSFERQSDVGRADRFNMEDVVTVEKNPV